jgi:hypothetical protein
VTVYCPWTLRVEVSEVTDPYSVSLAADGERTQVTAVLLFLTLIIVKRDEQGVALKAREEWALYLS